MAKKTIKERIDFIKGLGPYKRNPQELELIFAMAAATGYTVDDAIVFYALHILVNDGLTIDEFNKFYGKKK